MNDPTCRERCHRSGPIRLTRSAVSIAAALLLTPAISSAAVVIETAETVIGDNSGTHASPWNVNDSAYVGQTGTGSVTVSGAGVVNHHSVLFAGYDAGSLGTVTVTGPGSQWNDAKQIEVGLWGTGHLVIANGGAFAVTNGIARFGAEGSGDLAITGGGTFTVDGFVTLGNGPTSTGTATLSGAGSTWTTNGEVLVGEGGTGTLTIADGGSLRAKPTYSPRMVIAAYPGATGTVNIGAAAGAAAAPAGTSALSPVYFGDGAGKLVFNHTESGYNFDPAIEDLIPGTGAGTVEVEAGTTILTATSTYAGPTTVNGGILRVNGSTTSPTTVNSGGTLGGSGTIGATVTVNGGGSIAPGNSAGTLTVNGLVLAPGSVLAFELGDPAGVAGTDSDLLAVNGDVTLDGVVNVTALAGFGVGSYTLVGYTGNLTDNGLSVGTLPVGYDAVVNVDGAARKVTLTTALTTHTLTVAMDGNGAGAVGGGGSFNHGTTVTPTAAATAGSHFAAWTPASCGSPFALTADTTCTATFTLDTHTLTVAKNGSGAGTVGGGGSFNYGTTVTPTATATAGSHFAAWTPASCGSSFALTADTTCTATFALDMHAVTGSANPPAGGGVSCTSPVAHGDTATCTVTPNPGYQATAWGSDTCGGGSLPGSSFATGAVNADCRVTVDLAAAVPLLATWGLGALGAGLVGLGAGRLRRRRA